MREGSAIRTSLECQPYLPLDHWWQFLLLLFAILLASVAVIAISIRDRNQQPTLVIASIALLRIAALTMLVLAFLNCVKKRESVSETPSTIAVLIDTSLSMQLPGDEQQRTTRIEDAKSFLAGQEFELLKSQHQLVLYELQESGDPKPIARVNRTNQNTQSTQGVGSQSHFGWWSLALAAIFFGLSSWKLLGQSNHGLILMSAVILELFAFSWLAIAFLANDSADLPSQDPSSLQILSNDQIPRPALPEWNGGQINGLVCSQSISKIEESIANLIQESDSRALAGIVLLTDGGDSNDPQFATSTQLAANEGVPIFPIGLGALTNLTDLKLHDFDAPRKAYQNNPLTIRASLSVSKFSGPVEIVLSRRSTQQSDEQKVELQREVYSVVDSTTRPISFELNDLPLGEHLLELSATPLQQETDVANNTISGPCEVVDRKSKVMLFAGGPTREFRFLRDQLFRDPNVEVSVLLQSADEQAYLEADLLLDQFPESYDDLNNYDCIIAFDPDWNSLQSQQTEAVRKWVAEDAGGLIVIAGPVNTPEWTSRPRNDPVVAPIFTLYPVDFYSQLSGQVRLGRFGGPESFPLSFTQSAQSQDFLRFHNNAEENQKIWNRVQVYGFYAVDEEKPGAEVLAYFSDPLAGIGGNLPIYLASQLYGNGRVFFQASAELWRTRGIGPEFFEQYYARLIRWTSQGRLLRNDKALSLTLDKKRCQVGQFLTIRSIARKDHSEFDALKSIDVVWNKPTPAAESSNGQDLVETVSLQKLGLGTQVIFEKRVRIESPGRHQFQLLVPGDAERTILTADLLAKIPNNEMSVQGRNDAGLSRLAKGSGGEYAIISNLKNPEWEAGIARLVSDQSFLTVTPMEHDGPFTRKYQFCLFAGFALFLITGWIIRRLNRLA